MTDPYSVLGITPGADDETIKKAYRQKCKQYPQVGSIVRTPDGEGTVIETNVVAGTLKVRSNVEILAPRIYKREECVYIRGGKRAPQPADPED